MVRWGDASSGVSVAHIGEKIARALATVLARSMPVVIPAEIRRSLGLKEGDTVYFEVRDGERTVRPCHI